uniref:Uncharacterized protein n=1 Tax=Arundo donax TaxID=35708 RepID=A0A0A9ATY8_ARUDO
MGDSQSPSPPSARRGS